jgi:hypothetical protein
MQRAAQSSSMLWQEMFIIGLISCECLLFFYIMIHVLKFAGRYGGSKYSESVIKSLEPELGQNAR